MRDASWSQASTASLKSAIRSSSARSCSTTSAMEKCIFISFYKEPLVFTREILKEAEIQFLNDKIDEETFEFCKKYNFGLDVHYKAVTKESVKKFHKENLKVNVWTVDDPKLAKELVKMGVDYITTNILE